MRRFFQKKKSKKNSTSTAATSSDGAVDDNNGDVPPKEKEEHEQEQDRQLNEEGEEEKEEEDNQLKLEEPEKTSEAKAESEQFQFQYTSDDDLYGQTIPVETPTLLSTKLNDLQNELDAIPTDQKTDWLNAIQKCPDIVCTDEFRLMFLRCEILDAKLAAERIVRYWKKRVEIFGEDKAYLPLVLSSSSSNDNGKDKDSSASATASRPFNTPQDEQALSIGFLRCTTKTDSAGRPIIFGDPSRLPTDQSSYDVKAMCRALWYVLHHILQGEGKGNTANAKAETAQRKGAVVIMYPKHVSFGQFNRKLAKLNAESIKGCIPIRLSALHICHPPKVFDLIFPIIKVLMGAKLRKKVQLNSGTEESVLDKFENVYKIPKEDLPTDLGGMLVLDHDGWLEERRRNGD